VPLVVSFRPNRQRLSSRPEGDLPEEGVAQHHIVQAIQTRFIVDISINEKEYRQINLFPSSDLLFLEAKAFNLGKVRCDLSSALPLKNGLTFSGVILYVAIPIKSLSELFLAV
jgi:hypothetical protein